MSRSDSEASGNKGKGVTRNLGQNKRKTSSGRWEAGVSEGNGNERKGVTRNLDQNKRKNRSGRREAGRREAGRSEGNGATTMARKKTHASMSDTERQNDDSH